MTHSDPHSRAADAVHEGRPVEAQYVRQGRRGVHVVWILVVSLFLVVTAYAVLFLSSSEDMNATNADNNKGAAEAGPFAAPEPAPTTKQDVDEDPTAPHRGSTARGGQQPTAQPTESQSTD